MSDDARDAAPVRAIDWSHVFPPSLVARQLTAACQPTRLAIGALVVLVIIALGRGWDAVMPASVDPSGLLTEVTDDLRTARQAQLDAALTTWGDAPPADAEQVTVAFVLDVMDRTRTRHESAGQGERWARERAALVRLRPRETFEATASAVTDAITLLAGGVMTLDLDAARAGAALLAVEIPRALLRDHRAFFFGFGLIVLMVIGFGAAAIARCAACQIAERERPTAADALFWAGRHARPCLTAPLLPFMMAAVLACIGAVLGLLFAVPWLDAIAAVCYPVLLVIGALIAFLLIGGGFGFTMLVPAIAVESCDAIDAQQRAFAYVLNRPFRYVLVVITMLVVGAFGLTIVSAFLELVTASARASANGFITHDALTSAPNELASHERATRGMIGTWETLVHGVAAAWLVAYLASASTAQYLVLRRSCDGQPYTDVAPT